MSKTSLNHVSDIHRISLGTLSKCQHYWR